MKIRMLCVATAGAISLSCSDQPTSLSRGRVAPSLQSAALPANAGLDGQLIAFSSARNGVDVQLYVMKPTDTTATPLTAMPGAANFRPNWSHDGRAITFTNCGAPDFNCEVYVMKVDGSGVVNLTNDPGFDEGPVWSPDDRKIAFGSFRDGVSEHVYVMGADGSNLTRLTPDNADDFLPTWSPDGTRMAFESDRDGNSEVYVMGADGSNPRNLTQNPANDGSPSWSPRGNKIAFHSNRDGSFQIYLMNVDGSGVTKLTSTAGHDFAPRWSPDGNRIVFINLLDGNFEVYSIKSDGTQQVRLTNDPGANDLDPAWGIAALSGAFPPQRLQ